VDGLSGEDNVHHLTSIWRYDKFVNGFIEARIYASRTISLPRSTCRTPGR
jgi:hypothetical protein